MIEARGLIRRFGPLTAVDGVDLSIAGRGVVGFLGPNAAGKTTTLRMLAGFVSITSGTAEVAGFDVVHQPLQARARLGYVPESPPVYPDLTVRESLHHAGRLHGLRRAARRRRIGELLPRMGLSELGDRLVGRLSRGARQRVGLAQALLHDPVVLLLDEPTSGLDPGQCVALRGLIAELGRERAVLLSTHRLSDVEALCERVAVIHRGRIVADGPIARLAEEAGLPANAPLEQVYLALVDG